MWVSNIYKISLIYTGEDCMKNFYESLREQLEKIITFKRRKRRV